MNNSQHNLERLWRSAERSSLAEFYAMSRRPVDLTSFSRSRPRAPTEITVARRRVGAELVVVVPTADTGGSKARQTSNFYDPLPVVFVQSGGQFFNYAHSLNVGIEGALDMNPKWIVISNDDLLPIDSVQVLIRQIRLNHGNDYLLSQPNVGRGFGQLSALVELVPYSTTSEAMQRLPWALLNGTAQSTVLALRLERSYRLRWAINLIPEHRPEEKVLELRRTAYLLQSSMYSRGVREAGSLRNFAAFGVFNAELLRSHKFDENFINGYEDLDFALGLTASGHLPKLLEFEVGHARGTSLSPTPRAKSARVLREVLNKVYFCHKNEKTLSQLHNRASSFREKNIPMLKSQAPEAFITRILALNECCPRKQI